MTRKERMQFPAGMGFLFAGIALRRFGGESYVSLAAQIALFTAAIILNIRYMLKLRAERSRAADGG